MTPPFPFGVLPAAWRRPLLLAFAPALVVAHVGWGVRDGLAAAWGELRQGWAELG